MMRLWILALVGVLLRAQEPTHRDGNLSKEKEAALGARIVVEVRRQTGAIVDAPVHDYIAAFGRQLAAQMPGGDWDWEFEAVRDSVIAARQVGGGGVPRGEIGNVRIVFAARIVERKITNINAIRELSRGPLPPPYAAWILRPGDVRRLFSPYQTGRRPNLSALHRVA
jgi:hypothetical protein